MPKIAIIRLIQDFYIPINAVSEVKKTLSKTSEKINFLPGTSSLLFEFYPEEYRYQRIESSERQLYIVQKLRTIVYIGTDIWQFLGVLERGEDKNKLTTLNGRMVACPSFYLKSSLECDSCHNIGNRKYLYVFQNLNTGWIQKIGRECIDDFTLSKTSQVIDKMESLYSELKVYEHQRELLEPDSFPIRMILRLAIQLIDSKGYVKDGEDNTKRVVFDVLCGTHKVSEALINRFLLNDPFGSVPEGIELKVNHVIDYYLKIEKCNDYERRLKEIYSTETAINKKDIGLIVSSCVAALKK